MHSRARCCVYPARLARLPAKAAQLGVDLDLRGVRWADIRDRVFGRIDQIEASGRAHREKAPNVTVYAEPSRFVGPRRLAVGDGEVISADRVVIAAGGRPVLPDLPGLDDIAYHTSDTVMRLPELPRSMIIVGGGYVAAEFAHVFSAYGCAVTVVNRSDRLLRREDDDVAERFTELFGDQVDLRLEREIERVEPGTAGGVRLELSGSSGEPDVIEGDLLLIATGREPNSDRLERRRGRCRRGREGAGDRRRQAADQRRRRVRARRHLLALSAQARREPRSPGGPAQPAASGVHDRK